MTSSLCTIGHSNRELDSFIDVLDAFKVRCLVDVRSRPGSRRHPQFNQDALRSALVQASIDYLWWGEALGGYRQQSGQSNVHTALERHWAAYAAYAESEPFHAAISDLIRLSEQTSLAFMCAEKDPATCHRQFISDYLTHRGAKVTHLLDADAAREHRLNPVARAEDGRLVYDRMTQASLL